METVVIPARSEPPFKFATDKRLRAVAFHVVVFSAAFLIILSRRPDAVLNPQFYAEDGMIWFLDAYHRGIHSLLMPQGAYLHILKRLVALASLMVPLSSAPLLMNLCGITVQALPVNIFLSSRFRHLRLRLRLIAGLLYLGLPNSYEINATLTNVQWHLALLAFLVLVARPAPGWRIFDAAVLTVTSLDGPMGIVLVPVAGAMWWKRQNIQAGKRLALLIPGTLVQMVSICLTWNSRQIGVLGASFARLVTILGRQIFIPSLLGLTTTTRFLNIDHLTIFEVIATVIGTSLLFCALRYAPLELKLFTALSFVEFAMSLARPLAGLPDRPQWVSMCGPGAANRYYFLPMLSFLAGLVWMVVNKHHQRLRYTALALLLLLPIGVYQDWKYPPYIDMHFKTYAREFQHAPSGSKLAIPIYPPPLLMELTKH